MSELVLRLVVFAQMQVPKPVPKQPPGHESLTEPAGWIVWGVLFAIPLAFAVHAVALAWSSGGYAESRARAKSRMVAAGVAALVVGAAWFITQTLVDVGSRAGGG